MTEPAIPRYTFDERSQLIASKCGVCGYVSCPPQQTHCDQTVEPVALAPEGTLESWTTIRVAPRRFNAPYLLSFVRLIEGPRVVARLEAAGAASAPSAGARVILAEGSLGASGGPRRAVLVASLPAGRPGREVR